MFVQTDELNSFVFPIINAINIQDGEFAKITDLKGTGFFIGSRGFALTAAHVIEQLYEEKKSERVSSLFTSGNQSWVYDIVSYETHPSEDVGLIKINGKWRSIMQIDDSPQYGSAEYHCWGYPRHVAEEITKIIEGSLIGPELVFVQGYIRRRISRELTMRIFRGKQYYEVSETIGGGASGAPIILKNAIAGRQKWGCCGVYIGEKEGEGVNVGYAVRAEAFSDWKPKILEGLSIMEESFT